MPSVSSRQLELFRRGLAAVVRDDDTADVQPAALECVDQAQGVVVVGDAEVAAALVALDIVGRDGDDDLRVVAHLHEHAHLAVGGEARQHARCVVVVKEFAAELQIQLAAELADALADLFRLHLEVFIVDKAVACIDVSLLCLKLSNKHIFYSIRRIPAMGKCPIR